MPQNTPSYVEVCPECESENILIITRVVGYFSIVQNWNKSRQEERKKRTYWNGEVNKITTPNIPNSDQSEKTIPFNDSPPKKHRNLSNQTLNTKLAF